jgi:hypothetical protein
MLQIRVSKPRDVGHQDDCDLIYVGSYEMREVILPVLRDRRDVKAIQVTVHGRNLRAAAQPLVIFVGKTPLQFLRIAPDQRSAEGILLNEPDPGAPVEVHLGDQDAARHPDPVSPQAIKRI